MSRLLRGFLTAWIGWVDSGAPKFKPFNRGEGLCYSYNRWMKNLDMCTSDREGALSELHDGFDESGSNRLYPFGGEDQYDGECEADRMHENEDRLAWVRAKLALPAEAES